MRPPLDIFITKQISAAYRAGYKKCMEDRGELSKFISRNMAEKIYGRHVIQKLIDEGLIEIIKTGEGRTSTCRIDREKLDLVVSANEITPKRKRR